MNRRAPSLHNYLYDPVGRFYRILPSALVLCCSLAALGCASRAGPQRPSLYAIPQGLKIIAHRGGSLEAPENTLASLRHANEIGADWIEIDVTLSKNNVPVVIHDDTVDRTTQSAGWVKDLHWDELKTMDAGQPGWSEGQAAGVAKLGSEFSGFIYKGSAAERTIPSLKQVVEASRSWLMVELKGHSQPDLLVRHSYRVLNDAHALDRIIVGSFDPKVLQAMFNKDPGVPLIGIAGSKENLEVMKALPLAALALSKDLVIDLGNEIETYRQTLSPAEQAVFQASLAGVPVWVWTVNDVDEARKLEALGVAGVITDRPQYFFASLRAPPPLYVTPSELRPDGFQSN